MIYPLLKKQQKFFPTEAILKPEKPTDFLREELRIRLAALKEIELYC